MYRSLVPLMLLTACSTPPDPTLSGQVIDIWGSPIAGVSILVDGSSDRPLTDEHGLFTLPLHAEKYELKAGREGYVQGALTHTVSNLEAPERVQLTLYPKPKKNGYFYINTDNYTELIPQRVERMGNENRTIQGFKTIGDVHVKPNLKIVYHTDLRSDEIARAGLELHKLTFVPSTTLAGPRGNESVKVNLFTSAGKVDISITPLKSKNDYLIEAKGLDGEFYALQTQSMLSPKNYEAFTTIPEDLRIAFPFSVK